MRIKRLRMFAGPNGSGKSELIKRLKETNLPLGPVVNADEILDNLQNSGYIDLTEYSLTDIELQDWFTALEEQEELSSRVKKAGDVPSIRIEDDLIVLGSNKVNAYQAALIADFIRYMLIGAEANFSFETVMSHPGKIDFLKFANKMGYKTYLYYIATDDDEINVNRVKTRTKKGGHNVPINKVRSRYKKSLQLLFEALNTVDRAFILDSSSSKSSVVFEKKNNGKGYPQVESYPSWFEKYFIKKLT